jgi:hypothetical protein
MAGQRLGADLAFRHHDAFFRDALLKRAVLFRIHDVETAGHDGHGAGRQRSGMGAGIDPARQTGYDDEPGFTQVARQHFREPLAVDRGVAGADHGDRAFPQQKRMADDRDQRRSVVDRGQGLRVVGLACGNQPRPELGQRRHFTLRLRPGGYPQRRLASAAFRQIGKRLDRFSRRIEPFHQTGEGDRTDVLGANQPQPVKPLNVGQCASQLSHAAPYRGIRHGQTLPHT